MKCVSKYIGGTLVWTFRIKIGIYDRCTFFNEIILETITAYWTCQNRICEHIKGSPSVLFQTSIFGVRCISFFI